MTPAVRASLERVLAAPEDERPRILETLPPEVRTEVLELLRFDSPAGSGVIDALIADAARAFTADRLDETPVTPGMNLGPYRVESALGAGGMGTVYRARDTRLDRTVALKILAPGRIVDPAWKLRFQREARAASLLSHPNIVTLYDIATEDGIDFLVFEHVTGKTLKELIPPSGLPLEAALGLAAQIANGLAAAHAAGIVHRDIKPANVIVTEESRAKILDFGLAKLQAPSLIAGLETGHTASGIIMGTVTYMSPERVAGRAVDHRTDIFSLGILLYEMLCGARPFTGPQAGILRREKTEDG
jgi:serine/threonine protein kinase